MTRLGTLLLLILTLITRCMEARAVLDTAGFLDRLRTEGVSVTSTGEVAQPFFSVTGQVIRVYGESVQVFEFSSAAAAENAAAQVAPDGFSIGEYQVDWVGTPHFYRQGKLIVLYVGDTPDIAQLLEKILGLQFAGGSWIPEI